MTPLRIELSLEEVVDLHLALGDDDGRLHSLRHALLEYMYEHLSIAQLEELEGLKTQWSETYNGRSHHGPKGRE